jgi:hypothetical protein
MEKPLNFDYSLEEVTVWEEKPGCNSNSLRLFKLKELYESRKYVLYFIQ